MHLSSENPSHVHAPATAVPSAHFTGTAPLVSEAQAAHALAQHLKAAIGQHIVGQHDIIEQLLVSLFAGGHALFVGVPGLAKTMLVRALAEALALSFQRIQFTPDLMPTDITGGSMLSGNAADGMQLAFVPGPLFANIVLADEINRTPPKTQAALLQSMQEATVTVGGKTYPLPQPFHVLATQNPLEQEGTYPLPEAQLDRFLLMLTLDYPSAEDEFTIAQPQQRKVAPLPPADADALRQAQALAPQVPVPEALVRAVVAIVRGTRPQDAQASPAVVQQVAFGAGPRASQHLIRLCQARALVCGRYAVQAEDIRALAAPCLRHRLVMQPQAAGDWRTVDALIAELLVDALRA